MRGDYVRSTDTKSSNYLWRTKANSVVNEQVREFWRIVDREAMVAASEGRLSFQLEIDFQALKNKKEFLDRLSERCKQEGIEMFALKSNSDNKCITFKATGF